MTARIGIRDISSESLGRILSVSVAALVDDASRFTGASIDFAEGISHASSGERLGQIMRTAMEDRPGAYRTVRAAVEERVSALGGAGGSIGLFMLAADMATTASVAANLLGDGDRHQLTRLWRDLLSREVGESASLIRPAPG